MGYRDLRLQRLDSRTRDAWVGAVAALIALGLFSAAEWWAARAAKEIEVARRLAELDAEVDRLRSKGQKPAQ
jgi:hypothetical protein